MNIGVFVCGFSGNISKHIDTGKVAKETLKKSMRECEFVTAYSA